MSEFRFLVRKLMRFSSGRKSLLLLSEVSVRAKGLCAGWVCVCLCVLISRRCRARWAKSMLTCCLWCASTRIFIGLWSQKALSIFLVEIRVLYSLGRGQKQDPKRRHYKCLEMDGMVQATGPVIPKSSCHQKHMKQLFGIFVCFKFFLFFFKFFLHLGY